jgi:hypothetical protein
MKNKKEKIIKNRDILIPLCGKNNKETFIFWAYRSKLKKKEKSAKGQLSYRITFRQPNIIFRIQRMCTPAQLLLN